MIQKPKMKVFDAVMGDEVRMDGAQVTFIEPMDGQQD